MVVIILRETIGYYNCELSYLAFECKRGWRVVSIRTTGSPAASLPFKGQVTEQRTVKRSIHPKLIEGKFSIKYCFFNMFKFTVNPFDQADCGAHLLNVNVERERPIKTIQYTFLLQFVCMNGDSAIHLLHQLHLEFFLAVAHLILLSTKRKTNLFTSSH